MESHTGDLSTPAPPAVEPPVQKPTRILASLGDWFPYALTRVAGLDTTFEEARAQTYGVTTSLPAHAVDHEKAEFLFKVQREDSAHTDEKVRQLLTLSSSLATFILVFARDVRPRWIVISLLALLVFTVFLCLSVLGVRRTQLPTAEKGARNAADQTWGSDILSSVLANRASHSFRVDRYRAATRYFRLALLLTPIAALFTVTKPDPTLPAQRSADAIKTSIDSLRMTIETVGVRGLVIRQPPASVIVAPSKSSKAPADTPKAVRRPGPGG